MLFCYYTIFFVVVGGGGGSGGGSGGCRGGRVCQFLVDSFWLSLMCGRWFRLSAVSGRTGKKINQDETPYCIKRSKTVYWFE